MTVLAAVPLYPLVTPQPLVETGVAPVYSAAPAGLSWRTDSGTLLHVKNGGGGGTTVTVPRVGALADLVLSVPAGGERLVACPYPFTEVGAISTAADANPANGGINRDTLHSDYANASFSVLTGVTYGLFGIPLLRGGLRGTPTLGSGTGPVVAGTTALTVQPLDAWAAVTPTYVAAAAGGHHLSAAGGTDGLGVIPRYVIHVKNAGGSPTSVTLQARALHPDGTWGALVDALSGPVSVPAGGEKMWTPLGQDHWPAEIFGAKAWYATLSYSATASVTVAVFAAITA